jgi:hypothetical protein
MKHDAHPRKVRRELAQHLRDGRIDDVVRHAEPHLALVGIRREPYASASSLSASIRRA